MKTPRTPTEALTCKITKKIAEGIPPEVAARMCGVSLGVFCEWMLRGEGRDPNKKPTPRYRTFYAAVDQAEAKAIADKVSALNRSIRRGKVRPIMWYLERRDAAHFPASKPGVTIGGNLSTTIVQQIQAVTTAAAQAEDPRWVLEREQLEQRERTALPPAEPELQTPLSFIPNVIRDGSNVVEMIATASPELGDNSPEPAPVATRA